MNTSYKDSIIAFYQSHKRMPTYTEMMQLFDFKSKNAVYRVVQKMIDIGLVAKDRAGKLIPNSNFNNVPMVGLVTAGLPAPSAEVVDSLNIEDYLLPKKSSTYLFEVAGDSMIDAHIADGDIVIAERTHTAKDGAIVIANIDGEFTMKYLRMKDGKTWLEPANKNYKPLYPRESLSVIAVITGVMRKY